MSPARDERTMCAAILLGLLSLSTKRFFRPLRDWRERKALCPSAKALGHLAFLSRQSRKGRKNHFVFKPVRTRSRVRRTVLSSLTGLVALDGAIPSAKALGNSQTP